MTSLFIYEPVGRSECLKKGFFFAGPYGHLVQKKKRKKEKEKKALQKPNVHEATSSSSPAFLWHSLVMLLLRRGLKYLQ